MTTDLPIPVERILEEVAAGAELALAAHGRLISLHCDGLRLDQGEFELRDGGLFIRFWGGDSKAVYEAVLAEDGIYEVPDVCGVLAGSDGVELSFSRERGFFNTIGSYSGGSWAFVPQPRLSRGGTSPQYYFGRLHADLRGFQPTFRVVTTAQDGSPGLLTGIAFPGRSLSYYFAGPPYGAGAETFVVIDTGPERLFDLGRLDREFHCLQFVLGQPLSLSNLVCLDDAGTVTGWQGLGWRRIEMNGRRPAPPVPTTLSNSSALLRDLFRKTANRIEDPALRLFLPLTYYVESLADHLDGEYLKLQLALEAFAKQLLRGSPKALPLVRDVAKWKTYVRSLANNVREHAPTEEDGKILLRKVTEAFQRPTGTKVRLAFEKYGDELSKEEEKEISGRNVVAHDALMSDPENRSVLTDRERTDMVRRLLVRLVALAVSDEDPDRAGQART